MDRDQRPVDLDDDNTWAETEIEDGPEAVAQSGSRSGFRKRDHSGRAERPSRRIGITLFEDPIASGLVLLTAVSVAAMWGLVRLLIDDVNNPLTLRIRADGSPGAASGSGAAWQVPFVASMLGLMSIGTALLIARRDRFASRFVVGTGILVQAMIWVAAITLLR